MSLDELNLEQGFGIITENISDGLIVLHDLKIEYCNARFARMLDYSASEIRNSPFTKLLSDDRINNHKLLSDLNRPEINTPTRFKAGLRRKNGDEIRVELTIQTFMRRGERSLITLVRRESEQNNVKNIVAEQDRYKTLWELSPSGIILEDAIGTIIDVNPALCRYMGYAREELIGRPVHILAHPDKQKDVNKNIDLLLDGKVLRHHAKSIAKDGSIRYMELHETKVIMPAGEPGILSIAADATEQIRADEEKLRREKMQSILEIAGAVCHELNQPMTVISVNCDLILMNRFSREEIFEKIEVVKKQIRRMTNITQKLMHITKYETRDYLDGTRIVDIDRATGYIPPDTSGRE